MKDFKVKIRKSVHEDEIIYTGHRIKIELEDGREILLSLNNIGEFQVSQEHMLIQPVVSNVIIIDKY